MSGVVEGYPGTRVLWLVDEDDMNVMPEHPPEWMKVFVRMRGVTDHYYLKHKSITLVVSHCGLSAAQNSLIDFKPVVCIPFFGDQLDVAVRVKEVRPSEGRRIGRAKRRPHTTTAQ